MMLHCKPHVPSTPPEPSLNPLNEAAKDNVVIHIEKPSPKEVTPKQVIPGMPEVDRLKQIKKKKKKENRRKKNEVEERKTGSLVKNDFLKKRKVSGATSIENASDEFVFSGCDTDTDADEFEDSKEVLSDSDESFEDFLTPINFKSTFGLRLSSSTPDLTVKAKRPAQSPIEKAERKKSKS